MALIHVAPEDVATTITREPGYLAIASGEVIYIIKCIPITCQTRRTTECYIELPVTYRNESYFLTPRNRILIKRGPRESAVLYYPRCTKSTVNGTDFFQIQ